ncbi:hypothetical protein VP01_941g14 [Puccinia sorghi]|uniref:Uncharacterized protein n=1 Tax=Puccinia sorghi TaxID=27349 RepID=A0A0L6U6N9_9BASI|nr:hypothetical protein VP01_941g14 [Puccinia sorghi]
MAILDISKSGVEIQAPPKSLRYKCCHSSSKRKKISHSSQDPGTSLAKMFADVIAGTSGTKDSNGNLPSSSEAGLYHSEVEIPIINYLKFLRLARLNEVHDILTSNDIHSHKIFSPNSSLDRKEVLILGLTLGVVTKLFDNVVRFDKYLSRNNLNNV